MRLSDFDYQLPKNLIAQQPRKPRDQSRLLVMRRKPGKIEHKYFYDIIDYLNKGDVLVLNNTKVMPARLIGKRAGTGGKVEVFLLKRPPLNLPLSKGEKKGGGGEVWQCLVGGRRKENLKVEFEKNLKAEIVKNNLDGTWNIKFNKGGASFMKIVQKIGRVPLPPYIKRNQDSIASLQNDKNNYQTVYADHAKLGSVAAPTAGFHFTPELLKKIKSKGVQIEYITLQVGLGTFAPVKVDDITKHKMHAEYVEADAKTIARLYLAKHEGQRIIAVGTTSVRTLEAIVSEFPISNFQFSMTKFSKQFVNYKNWVNIFIYPGYKFKAIDGLITNFHLPKSTLIMLIAAFAGKSKIFKAYGQAIKKKYRFYSYGDAMLII